MYIPLQGILNKFKIKPKGVIQVGAHWAEEHDEFINCGAGRMVYIEPCKEAFSVLLDKFGGEPNEQIILVNAACGTEQKEATMYVSHQNQGQSNSFLEAFLHLEQHPSIIFDDIEVVNMVTLDSLLIDRSLYNILVVDVEGFEKDVILGGVETLNHIDAIYIEVHRGETRKGNILVDDLDTLLRNFKRVETFWPSPNLTWGDAFYIRK